MIYLDNGATSFPKPPQVTRAVQWALSHCANPGRGGHRPAMEAARVLFACREQAAELFDCQPEQVVFTGSCTQGLNMAIETLVKPGDKVVISGFEHNAVTRPLFARRAEILVAGRRLFDWEDTLSRFEKALQQKPAAAVFTHCSNVFGYILPVKEMGALCRQYGVPFAVDAAQSAGALPVKLNQLGADYIAMPGHKGLLGPQGTGLLLCSRMPKSLIQGGTGTQSLSQQMPGELPEGAEPGTVNVPGIAGLYSGLKLLKREGIDRIFHREQALARLCVKELKKLGYQVFFGENQGGTVSFVGKEDCEALAQRLAEKGIALRAGLHCAPLAHESAGTLETGTVRVSFGWNGSPEQVWGLRKALEIS